MMYYRSYKYLQCIANLISSRTMSSDPRSTISSRKWRRTTNVLFVWLRVEHPFLLNRKLWDQSKTSQPDFEALNWLKSFWKMGVPSFFIIDLSLLFHLHKDYQLMRFYCLRTQIINSKSWSMWFPLMQNIPKIFCTLLFRLFMTTWTVHSSLDNCFLLAPSMSCVLLYLTLFQNKLRKTRYTLKKICLLSWQTHQKYWESS